jgi:hypothetical protein
MAFGGIKNYHLIRLDFSKDVYEVYPYQKDRRFTANQAWQHIYNHKPNITGKLAPNATIATYGELVEKLGYDPKYCDRYMTFRGFN